VRLIVVIVVVVVVVAVVVAVAIIVAASLVALLAALLDEVVLVQHTANLLHQLAGGRVTALAGLVVATVAAGACVARPVRVGVAAVTVASGAGGAGVAGAV
jgi:hypothetical protein